MSEDLPDNLTPAEAALEMVRLHMEHAEVVETYAPERADVIRTVAGRFEEALETHLPEWMDLNEVQRHTGWSKSHLRKKARELEDTGLARRNPNWEIRRSAVGEGEEIPPKKDHERPLIDMDDISGTARRLARTG